MKSKEWKIPYVKPEIPAALTEAGCEPLLAAALALRGIRTAEAAGAFIDCSSDCLHEPLLMTGMAEARERILRAVALKETVAVYGDYDVDGITSTCLVADYLRSRGLDCRTYIPDRNEEGYGLNCAALDALAAQGVSLLITVDCGITAVAEARHAGQLGMDMIITDHHECLGGALPEAAAVIDCKQDGDNYPNKNLAGVGVALKLVCACEGGSAEMLARYADLVAVGTVADVMPLVDENRYLVKLGLEKLERAPRPGIAAMLRESAADTKKISSATIGFSLAPRLNAAGRLGHAESAARLLMCDDEKAAAALAAELCEMNRRRQDIETEIWREASELIAGTEPDAPIVLASDKWHQGVIGIAASRLAEQYSLPAIMICLNGEQGKGSCRSFGGFNLFEALSACSKYLVGFGGHALAAGLNIRRDRLDAFREALAEYYRANRPAPRPEVRCDLLINDPALLSIDNVRSLDRLEPFGNMNPKPVMCVSGAELEAASAVGGGKHLRVRLRLGHSRFDGIFFSHTAEQLGIAEGDSVDVAFTPQINEFHGHVSVQLMISAARKHDASALCRAILEKDASAVWAAAPYCPAREDFVRVWRANGDGFTVADDSEGVIGQRPGGMAPECFCLCLMALLEAGLLGSGDGRVFGATRRAIDGKADLDATELIKALKTA
ncbi:MAG: single-stranded-DNA-specific exonuclease RecJ [Oscillospiraceae bacterium]|nr:single-stranded-DNA-specific exonuclease RecJ [Oscillospiraceae bacterium]